MSVLRFRLSFAAAAVASSLVLAPATAAGQQVERPAAVREAGTRCCHGRGAEAMRGLVVDSIPRGRGKALREMAATGRRQ